MMDRKENRRFTIDMVPMINVIFLLLMFFLLAGTITTPDVLELAMPVSGKEKSADQITSVILLDKTGALALDNRRIAKNELPGLLAPVLKDKPHMPVTIKADAGLPAHALVSVIRIVTEAGGQNVVIATTPEPL